MEQKIFHRRNLPHLHPSKGIFFITYCLAGSLPVEAIRRLREEIEEEKRVAQINNLPYTKGFFTRYDALLDNAKASHITNLCNAEIATINKNQLLYYNGKYYDLIAYCIMPNHIHIVFSLIENSRDVSQIMQSIKRYTARECNKVLKREGKFWQDESFDRLVRNETEFKKIVDYVINNPVKAGFVKTWEEWKWTYCNFDYL